MVPTLKVLAFILLFLTLAVFLFGMIASSKLIAVEMLAVVQLAYIGLIMIDKMEALIYPLINLWPINGYNNLANDDTEVPSRVSAPGYKALLLANFNIDFVLIVIPFIVGICFWAYGRKKVDK